MIYDILAIFNDVELVEVESTLNQCILMNQRVKNQLLQAVEDYRFLVGSLLSARGLSQQVTLFLLDPSSCTQKGIEEFLEKLETWIIILEDEVEQRVYAEILRHYDIPHFETNEILALRSDLIEVLVEIQEVKRTLKKTKNSQDSLVKNKIPMQLDSEFDYYDSWMMKYGSEFDKDDSSYKIVPDLRGKISDDQPSFYEAFRVDLQSWSMLTKEEGSETIIG